MHKIKNILLIITGLLLLESMVSCKKIEPEIGYIAPNAPSTINQVNVFTVEFYSLLNNDKLFETVNYEGIISHIMANKTPIVYFFDRIDHTIGQTSAINQIGWESKTNSFFVQNTQNELNIEGTGMIVRPIINNLSGSAFPDSLYFSGCTMVAPCAQPVVVNMLTCRLNREYQFSLLSRALGKNLDSNKIFIGTISGNLEKKFTDYLKYNFTEFRINIFSSSQADKTYKIFCLSPVNFVNREIVELTVSGIPMYQCKIEYLN